MEEVVISGLGCVTPIGVGAEAFGASLRAGVSGMGPLTGFDSAQFRCHVAAAVSNFRAEDFMPLRDARSLPRCTQLAIAASRMALEQSALASPPERIGVVIGSSIGPGAYNFEQFGTFVERGVRRVPPQFPALAHNGSVASECSIQFGLRGPALTVSSACVSGADAIGLGRMMIRSGVADVVLAGGVDAPITPMLFAAFDRLGLMSSRYNEEPHVAMRPFDRDRDGFVLGEGAAMFVLEGLEHSRQRGAKPVAAIRGYGATSDAFGHFGQPEEPVDAVRAIHLALADAGLSVGAVEYVNAHGSATVQNDIFETGVLRAAFGDKAHGLPVSATKSMIGHAMGAAPALGIMAICLGMEGGFIPPTIGLENPDERCALNHVRGVALVKEFECALSLSFGFGSRNAAVVVGRAG